ncbi:MAG: hypothetical protein RDU24_05585 [Humidesulfovibrio sp.]|uniref:hypothetical protein n=1 Tax=Humidesulfovibrio sp. TaxID=2910988 RepID=UPI0027F8EE9F|nr:hypothetical protein [Humidesulfovibrio sp.]MDQ7834833.1 hypothetical protein [Humidesulfovibrio sp.]
MSHFEASCPRPNPLTEPHRPALLFLALALVLCVDQILGPYALVRFHDWFDDGVFSERMLALDFFRHGLTGWRPSLGGLPTFVGQKPPYDPLALAFALIPPWLVDAALNLGVLFLAGWGMEGMLRKFFGVSRRIACFGAVLFLFSSMMRVRCLFVFVFPTFFLLSLDLFDGGLRLPQRLLRLAGLLGLTLFSFPVITLPEFSTLHFVLLLLFSRRDQLARRLGGVVLLWTAYALIYLPLFQQLLDYLPNINRVYAEKVYDGLLPALKSIGLALKDQPNDSIGLGLLLLGLPVAARSRQARRGLFIALIFHGIYLFALSPFSSMFHGTFLEKVDLYNFRQVVSFSFPLFVALALEHMRSEGRMPPLWMVLLAFGITLPWAGADTGLRTAFMMAAGLGTLALCLGGGFPRRKSTMAVAMAISMTGLVGAGMMTMAQLLVDYSHVPYVRAFGNVPELSALATGQSAPSRVGCLDLAPAVAMSNGLVTVGEKKVLFNKDYKRYVLAVNQPQWANNPQERFQQEARHIELYLSRPRDSMTVRRDVVTNAGRPLAATEWNMPLLLAMNVTHLISSKPVAGLEAYGPPPQVVVGGGLPDFVPEAFRGGALERFYSLPLWIYHLDGALPRAYFTSEAVVLDSQDAVEHALLAQDMDGLRRRAFFAAADVPGANLFSPPSSLNGGEAKVLASTPDELVVQVRAENAGHLLVSNCWDKGWFARVDGAATPVLRANMAFQAVAIPGPGEHRVELAYRNPMVGWMHLASLTGLLLMLGLALSPRLAASQHQLKTDSPPASAVAEQPAPARVALLSGGVLVTLWSVVFFLSRVLREPIASHRPMTYALLKGLAVGVLLCVWWLWAARSSIDRGGCDN